MMCGRSMAVGHGAGQVRGFGGEDTPRARCRTSQRDRGGIHRSDAYFCVVVAVAGAIVAPEIAAFCFGPMVCLTARVALAFAVTTSLSAGVRAPG